MTLQPHEWFINLASEDIPLSYYTGIATVRSSGENLQLMYKFHIVYSPLLTSDWLAVCNVYFTMLLLVGHVFCYASIGWPCALFVLSHSPIGWSFRQSSGSMDPDTTFRFRVSVLESDLKILERVK